MSIPAKQGITYVTAFLDIGRAQWSTFARTPDVYLASFADMLGMLSKDPTVTLVAFVDRGCRTRVLELLHMYPLVNCLLTWIDEEWMCTYSPMWSRLDAEQRVLDSDTYQALCAHRRTFPENWCAKYTLINHCKIDFIDRAMQLCNGSNMFCWVDFGYFQNRATIPTRCLDPAHFVDGRVHYSLINPLDDRDADMVYTLQHAPERIGGFWFCGMRAALTAYCTLYRDVHSSMQAIHVVDDDQHVALRCCVAQPSLFTLHMLGMWHAALIVFQKR